MTVKLMTEHHLEFLSINGGCTGSSESAPVKMLHCWKSHVAAHFFVDTTEIWVEYVWKSQGHYVG